jgi:hypothetical protein
MKGVDRQSTFVDTAKVFMWDLFFRFVLFMGRLRYPIKKEHVRGKLHVEKSNSEIHSPKSIQKEETLEEIIKQLVSLEEELRKMNESDSLLIYEVAREDKFAWIEARRARIQSYCTSVPFNESDPSHMKEAARNYREALQKRLQEYE